MGASSSGCNVFFAVTLILSCIFAAAWTVLAVIGFMLMNCDISLDHNNPAYIIKLVYFYNEECVCEDLPWACSYLNIKTSDRTVGVLWWYAVSGGLRAICAVGAIVAMAICSCHAKPRASTPQPSPFAWVWVAVSFAGLIGDLVCSVFYALDIAHAQDIKELTGSTWEIPSSIEDLFWALKLCPIMMMLFCSRFFVFWILDACLLIMTIISLARQRNEAKLQGAYPPGDDLGPWKSQFTKASGVDRVKTESQNGRSNEQNNGNAGHMDQWPDKQPVIVRSVSEYYAEPLTNGGDTGQPSRDYGGGGAYMSSPIHDPSSNALKTPSDIYSQPWAFGRPPPATGGHSRVDAPWQPPPATGGHSPRMDAPWPAPTPSSRGDWDPRSPWPNPSSEPVFFPNTGYGKPLPTHSSPAQEQPPPSRGAHRTSNGGAPADKERPRRYIEKLRDVEEERLAKEEAREAERRRRAQEREDELVEEQLRHAESVKQEMIAKANAMERSRKLRREAAGDRDAGEETKRENEGNGVRKRGPAPPPPPRPRRPDELKNQTPWSYVGPALAHPKDLPMQNRTGRDEADEEDEDKPAVPVPDYTLHIKRPNDRPMIDTN